MILATILASAATSGWWFAHRQGKPPPQAFFDGAIPSRAPALLRRYGCANCHRIDGIAAAGGRVGPSVSGIAGQRYIGGTLMNSPANLVRWIVDPRAVNPHSAMPATGIGFEDARSVGAYLYQH